MTVKEQNQGVLTLLHRVIALRAALNEIMPVVARHSAPEFSPFEFVRKDELGLSAIIRWLFDPEGSHGQGGLFLRAFLDALGNDGDFDDADCARATVHCEVPTTFPGQENRRIDILVRIGGGPDDYCIAIENKPWAAWQENQLASYLNDISQIYKNPQRRRIVALKGWRGDTDADQLEFERRGELIDTDYVTLTDILRSTVNQCEAESVRRFVMQFVLFLDQTFGGRKITIMSDHLSTHILNDPSLATAAFELLESRSNLLTEVAGRFANSIVQFARREGLQVTVDDDLLRNGAHVDLFLDGGDSPKFRIAFGTGLIGPYWGLPQQGNEDHLVRSPEIIQKVRERVFRVRTNDGWIWWQWLSEVSELTDNAKVWRSMLDGSLATMVVEEAKRALDSS